MTVKTHIDVARVVLSKLGHVPTGQAADGEEFNISKDAVKGVWEELGRSGVAYWSIDEFPLMAVEPFAAYVAGVIADRFRDPAEAIGFKALMAPAHRRLVAMAHEPDNSGRPTEFMTF